MDLLGQSLDKWDYWTLVAGIAMVASLCALVLFIMGLPGSIAIKRNHPHAESVKIMGWMGFLAAIPWLHAFMWAFHDSVTVDLRRFPKEEREEIRKEIARLKDKGNDKDADKEQSMSADTKSDTQEA